MSNYQQPDFRVPTTDPRVTVIVEGINNPLALSFPLPRYIVDLGVEVKLDPSGNIRNGKSGSGKPG
jgi:hypothetical protein